jgi:hypothetical protein
VRRALIAAAIAASMILPAGALELDANGLAAEAACVTIGLGTPQCACIAADDMERNDPEMRAIVLLSLEDMVGFAIRARSGEFPREQIAALNEYQRFVEAKCEVVQ